MPPVQTPTANLSDTKTAPVPYRYAHLLPSLSRTTYPPLTPFEHTDPGLRALAHSNPRSLLDAASGTIELTPNFGTELYGISLARLDSDSRDQLALEVSYCLPYPIVSFTTGCV